MHAHSYGKRCAAPSSRAIARAAAIAASPQPLSSSAPHTVWLLLQCCFEQNSLLLIRVYTARPKARNYNKIVFFSCVPFSQQPNYQYFIEYSIEFLQKSCCELRVQPEKCAYWGNVQRRPDNRLCVWFFWLVSPIHIVFSAPRKSDRSPFVCDLFTRLQASRRSFVGRFQSDVHGANEIILCAYFVCVKNLAFVLKRSEGSSASLQKYQCFYSTSACPVKCWCVILCNRRISALSSTTTNGPVQQYLYLNTAPSTKTLLQGYYSFYELSLHKRLSNCGDPEHFSFLRKECITRYVCRLFICCFWFNFFVPPRITHWLVIVSSRPSVYVRAEKFLIQEIAKMLWMESFLWFCR